MKAMIVRRSPVIVGRDRELDSLREALDQCLASEQPAVVVITGEAGIGKSRLAEAATDEAAAREMWCVSGRCVASGGEIRPIAAVRDVAIELIDLIDDEELADLADTDARGLRGLIPGSGHDDTTLTPNRLVDLVLGTIRSVARSNPILVVIDDLHWADATTLRLTSALATARWLGAVTVLVTIRTEELHAHNPAMPFLDEIVRAVRPLRLELEPLDDGEVRALCDQLRDEDADASIVDDAVRRANGNPFMIEELLGSSRAAGASDTLRGALLGRVPALDESIIRVLQTLALAGAARAEVVGDACDLSAPHLDEIIGALCRAGILVHDDTDLAFRHDLSREVFADIAPGRRVELHAALAESLARSPASHPGEIARHRLAGGDHAGALVAALDAARVALGVGAAAEALDHFLTVIDLWPNVGDADIRTGTDVPAILIEAATAALHADQLVVGADLARRADASTPSSELDRRADALLLLRNLYRYQSRWSECSRVVDELLDIVPAEPPTRRRAFALAYAALEHRYANTDGSSLAQESLDVALASGDLEAIIEARAIRCIWLPLDQWLSYAQATVDLIDDSVGTEHALRALNSLAIVQFYTGRLQDFRSTARRSSEIARSAGLAGPFGAKMLGYEILGATLTGAWDRAVELAKETTHATPNDHHMYALLVAHRRGIDLDREQVAQQLIEQRRDGVWDEFVLGDWIAMYLEVCGVESGEAAIDLAEDVLEQARVDDSTLVKVANALFDDLANRAAVLPPDQRGRSVDRWWSRIEPTFSRLGPELIEGVVREVSHTWGLKALAERARLHGRADVGAWTTVADAFTQLDIPYNEATARVRLAEAHLAGEAGRSVAAHEAAGLELDRAAELAGALGAVPLEEQIEQLRDAAGLVRTSAQSSDAIERPSPHDSFGLTEREREILTLVAQGKSNGEIGQALFISTKTASSHVSNILRKLGVSNRVEAATAAQRHHLLLEP